MRLSSLNRAERGSARAVLITMQAHRRGAFPWLTFNVAHLAALTPHPLTRPAQHTCFTQSDFVFPIVLAMRLVLAAEIDTLSLKDVEEWYQEVREREEL